MKVKSPNNVAIERAILALGRAHAQMPGFDLPRALDTATQIDSLLKEKRTLEATFAVCVTLLRLIGFDATAESLRLRS